MPGAIKPDLGGAPYNPEPATDPTITKRISFESCRQRFELSINVPVYMWRKLKISDWCQIEKWVRERAEVIREQAARAGNLTGWQDLLEHFARTCIYNQFSKAQIAAGNDSWAVPRQY